MENIVTMPNAGTLPTEYDREPEPEKTIEHVRNPELHRNGTKLMMSVAALVGAAAGARLLFGEWESVALTLGETFGEVFLRQTLLGALFLAAEFILGFFAFGDLAVWAAPLLCGAGVTLRIASSPKLIPSALFCLVGVVIGAAYSADMSALLLKLTRGGTVYLDTSPRRSYVLGFAGCLAAVMLGALVTSAIIVNT